MKSVPLSTTWQRVAQDLSALGYDASVLNDVAEEGLGPFIDIVVDARKDGVHLKLLDVLPPNMRSEVETRLRNPCRVCQTFHLEAAWVGSAYCSLKCLLQDREDPKEFRYAEQILQGMEAYERRNCCRSCQSMTPMTEERAALLEDSPGPDAEQARYECPACRPQDHSGRY